MFLVLEKKDKPGKWEVAWTWLPFFLASDTGLHKVVDRAMTEEFRGTKLEGDVHMMYPPSMTPILQKMHNRVVQLIIERYPIPGLRMYLESVLHVQPGGDPNGVATQDR